MCHTLSFFLTLTSELCYDEFKFPWILLSNVLDKFKLERQPLFDFSLEHISQGNLFGLIELRAYNQLNLYLAEIFLR